jgi:hypothetical protein
MNAALSLLDRIGESHRRMAALADALDWDGIVAEWQGIHPQIVELRRMALDRLTDREREQAARQIAELLEFEKRISARITPWMEQARPLVETFRKYPVQKTAV